MPGMNRIGMISTLVLIGGLGNMALATILVLSEPAVPSADAVRRSPVVRSNSLTDSDVGELVSTAEPLMIHDVQNNPTYGRPPRDTVWKFRLLGIYSYEIVGSDTEKIRRFLSGRLRSSVLGACVDAELIPSTSTGPEMRYLYFIRDPDGHWQPQFPETGEMGRWASYYF